MSVTEKDRLVIRELAKRVSEIAGLPVHKQKRDMWIRLNRLERVRPLIHVQAIDASIWAELIPDDTLLTGNAFCREQEMGLRRKIYCWENFPDDRVVDDVVACSIIIRGDSRSTGFGMQAEMERPEMKYGAGLLKNTIERESDIEKIQTTPQVWVDWDETERRYERLSDLYDGILRV